MCNGWFWMILDDSDSELEDKHFIPFPASPTWMWTVCPVNQSGPRVCLLSRWRDGTVRAEIFQDGGWGGFGRDDGGRKRSVVWEDAELVQINVWRLQRSWRILWAMMMLRTRVRPSCVCMFSLCLCDFTPGTPKCPAKLLSVSSYHTITSFADRASCFLHAVSEVETFLRSVVLVCPPPGSSHCYYSLSQTTVTTSRQDCELMHRTGCTPDRYSVC